MTQRLHFSSLSGRQAVLPPAQPPHACHQVSTCPALLLSSSSSPYNMLMFPLSRCMDAYSWGARFRPTSPLFCNEWTNSSTARNEPPFPLQLGLPARLWAAVGSRVQDSVQVEAGCQVLMTGGLYEVALKGLRRATCYKHLSLNLSSVMGELNLC